MSEYDVISLVENCVIPWQSLDSCSLRKKKRRSAERVIDGKELMMMCFNCKKEECDNCHDRRRSDKRKIRMMETRKIFLGYLRAGYDKAQICEAMHISSTTYTRYLHNFRTEKR